MFDGGLKLQGKSKKDYIGGEATKFYDCFLPENVGIEVMCFCLGQSHLSNLVLARTASHCQFMSHLLARRHLVLSLLRSRLVFLLARGISSVRLFSRGVLSAKE